ncbi:MAG: ABC transporter permease subunit, partial [Pseudomonadota bacterium]
MLIYRSVKTFLTPTRDFTSLKTVTFGDESAVRSEFAASIISVVLIFVIWGSYTGSSLIPRFLHLPGPFIGETSFTYTLESADGQRDDAEVFVRVLEAGTEESDFEVEPGDGLALNDSIEIVEYRSEIVTWDRNDEVDRRNDGARLVAINGQEFQFDPNNEDENGNLIDTAPAFDLDFGRVAVTDRGTINVVPNQGWQMQPLYLPAPEVVWNRFIEIAKYGYQNVYLTVHLGFSLFRVILGFLLGAIVGIPLGYAMGLSNWFRGWFDPIVEFMRPVPPLALIPLVIIWFGIGEVGKIFLLFLAALWIMAIAARAGVSGVRITKVHAAYSLGASRWQILRHVIIPNSLPEIFTGARVAMGVCWGTVAATNSAATTVPQQ